MNPDEAAKTIKSEAESMARMVRGMRARKSSDFSQKDLLNWLCICLQQHADFKNSMAEFIESIGHTYPNFQLTPTTTQAEIVQSQPSINLEAPPFDVDFWMGLGDV